MYLQKWIADGFTALFAFIGQSVNQIHMNQTQWTLVFTGVCIFSFIWCCRGRGSRKNY
jgi:hypothetical protein